MICHVNIHVFVIHVDIIQVFMVKRPGLLIFWFSFLLFQISTEIFEPGLYSLERNIYSS